LRSPPSPFASLADTRMVQRPCVQSPRYVEVPDRSTSPSCSHPSDGSGRTVQEL
jgi:hypothetical protein